MSDEIRTILASLAYAMEEGEVDAGGGSFGAPMASEALRGRVRGGGLMSMLSAQCDKLRERAKVLRQGRWSDGADDARLMEDAADTIWELRGMVHKERAEADRLRDLVRDMVLNMGGCALHGNPLRLREFINRARELGIEVDDG